MELLLGALITIGTELYKIICSKVPEKFRKTLNGLIIIVAFVLSVVGVGVWKYSLGELNLSDWTSVVQTFLIAVGYYEILLKRFIKPIFTKSKEIKF